MDLKSETGSKSFLALELKVPHVSDFCLKRPLSYCCSTSPPGLNFSQAGDLGLLVLVTWESDIDQDQKRFCRVWWSPTHPLLLIKSRSLVLFRTDRNISSLRLAAEQASFWGCIQLSWILITFSVKVNVRVLSLNELALNYQGDRSLPQQWRSSRKWSPSLCEQCPESYCGPISPQLAAANKIPRRFFGCNCISNSKWRFFFLIWGASAHRHAWPPDLLGLAPVKEMCRYFFVPTCSLTFPRE